MTRRRAAVLGRPIEHSLSPVLHRAAYRVLGLDWDYDAVDCGVHDLPDVLARLSATHVGASLTMPLKTAALTLVDELAEEARSVGAVNTVLFGESGRLGANTDIAGAEAALRELGGAPEAVVLLGAGGAARAVVAALARIGVTTVTVYVRDPGRAGTLVGVADGVGVTVAVEPWASATPGVRAADLVVSTVPASAAAELTGPDWPPGTAVFDLLYHPWPTPLARAAAAAGAPVVGGLPMLVAQAADAVRLMTGCEPPVEAMRRAGEDALARR